MEVAGKSVKNYVRRAVLRLCSMDQPVFGSRQQVPSAGMDFPHAKFISQDISQHTDMDRAALTLLTAAKPPLLESLAIVGGSLICGFRFLSFHFHRRSLRGQRSNPANARCLIDRISCSSVCNDCSFHLTTLA